MCVCVHMYVYGEYTCTTYTRVCVDTTTTWLSRPCISAIGPFVFSSFREAFTVSFHGGCGLRSKINFAKTWQKRVPCPRVSRASQHQDRRQVSGRFTLRQSNMAMEDTLCIYVYIYIYLGIYIYIHI